MTRFSPLTLLLDDVPPDIDITQSKFLFGQVEWENPPTLIQTAHLDRRMTQDDLYKRVGNPHTWNQYVSLGYYVFDDCFQFETQWAKLSTNLTAKYKFLWFAYTYHTTRYLPVPTQLAAWAKAVAYPYLETHIPDGYTPDTTNTRSVRFDDSDDDMECEEEDAKPAAKPDNDYDGEDGWTLMGPNGKPIRVSPPASPTHEPPAPAPVACKPSTDPRPTLHKPILNALQNPVSQNDGTLRVTVKWSPTNYDQLLPTTDESWATHATDILHFLFITAPDCYYHTWDPKIAQRTIPILSLTPDNLFEFISPSITSIDSRTMFAFGVRVSMCDGGSPGPWINNQSTQAAMFKHRVEVSISNATSDSGDVAIAGYILLKDPTVTHHLYYSASLRSDLPTLPYFNLGVHRKSTQGVEVPHLVVRCGEKVVDQLSANLSVHLNGTTSTPLYISCEHMMNAPPDEVSGIFDLHRKYINTLVRISLSPHITHIDRLRTENPTPDHPQMERSTRQWASSLKDGNGTSLQCDVESGSHNRQVYLMVPTHHEAQARTEITSYLSRLANLRPSTF